MVKENYRIIIPFTHALDLELTPRLIDKQAELNNVTFQNELHKDAVNVEAINVSTVDFSSKEKMPAAMIQVIKTTQQAFSQLLSNQFTFLVATSTGFQLVRVDQILYFEYSKQKKQWVVFLYDQTSLLLRRNTVASDILNFSPSLFRISQQHIVNLDFLKLIDDKICKLTVPTLDAQTLIISRSCLKLLQEKIKVV